MVLSLNYEAEHVTCNLQVVIGCLCPFNVAVYVKTTRIYKKKQKLRVGHYSRWDIIFQKTLKVGHYSGWDIIQDWDIIQIITVY